MVPILLAPCIAGAVYFFGAYFPVFPPAVGFYLYTFLVVGATILLRYVLPDRPGLKPGHCVRCDYDLTGNESG